MYYDKIKHGTCINEINEKCEFIPKKQLGPNPGVRIISTRMLIDWLKGQKINHIVVLNNSKYEEKL